jgi:hypothetical protein
MNNETILRQALEECADSMAVLLAITEGRPMKDAWGTPIDMTGVHLAHVAALRALKEARPVIYKTGEPQ